MRPVNPHDAMRDLGAVISARGSSEVDPCMCLRDQLMWLALVGQGLPMDYVAAGLGSMISC